MRHHPRNSRLLRVPLITACIGVLGLAGLAGSAHAATQVGQVVVDQAIGGCNYCADVQVATDSSVTYEMPADGVLTSWRFHANSVAGTAHLRVYRPAATPGQFELLARTPDRTFALDEDATVPTQLPVKAGDRIGIGVVGPSPVFDTLDSDDHVGGVDFFKPIGSVASPNVNAGRRVNIAATLEADADRDGLGDETQDGCASDPTPQAICTSGPTAPASGAPAVDSSAPILALAAPRRESVKRGRLYLYAKTNEAAASVVTGRVRIGHSARSYRLRQANASIAEGSRKKIVVRIPKRSLVAIRAALHAGRSPKAQLTVLARDAAGNATKAVKRIRLVR
jgi:hypothetical protein